MRAIFIHYSDKTPIIVCENYDCRWNKGNMNCTLHNQKNPTVIHLSVGKTIGCDFYRKSKEGFFQEWDKAIKEMPLR